MKRRLRAILSITLCAIMIFGSVAIGGEGFAGVLDALSVKASAAKVTSYKTGDIIEFGWYPQTKETNSSIISILNKSGGIWTSYNYYSGTGDWDYGQMKPSDYMRYKDVMYGSTKYRGVTFDSYRPYCTGYTSSSNEQQSNGYYTGNVYWFKYEPIKWRVLDPSTGLVMCDTAIDSQAYNNYIWYGVGSLSSSSEYYGDEAHTYYASNYANSSIRAWLNKDFYNTAFSDEQKSNIVATTLDNSSTCSSAYDAPSTTDKIFLLSYNDSINSNYGFSSSGLAYDTARQLKSTDYAKCQGCYQEPSDSDRGNFWWWLRSPYDSSIACGIGSVGRSNYSFSVIFTFLGVVPALRLSNLKSDYTISETGLEKAISVSIINHSNISVDYKSTVVLNAVCGIDGASICWFDASTDKKVSDGTTYTVSQVTNSFSVYAAVVENGKIVEGTESETESVTVNTSFFAKIVAFFRGLFKKLPLWIDNVKQ